jgi:hypothetical protein
VGTTPIENRVVEPEDELITVVAERSEAAMYRRPWQTTVIAIALVIAAIALSVIAAAEVDQSRSSRLTACISKAQLESFGERTTTGSLEGMRRRVAECER